MGILVLLISVLSSSAGYCTAGEMTPRMKSTSATRSPPAIIKWPGRKKLTIEPGSSLISVQL
jgi:hypothetical protein